MAKSKTPPSSGDTLTPEDAPILPEAVQEKTFTAEAGPELSAPAEPAAEAAEPAESEPAQESEPVVIPAEEWAAQQAAAQDLRDRMLRLQAEFDNYRKRTAKERLQARAGAIEDITRAFLPVVDNFDRAVAAAVDHGLDEEHLTGWRLVHQQLYDVLRNFGVEPMAVIGQPFDPQYHDAMAEVTDDAVSPGHVAAEIERGYLVGGRVLRTAKVTVCRGPAAPQDVTED